MLKFLGPISAGPTGANSLPTTAGPTGTARNTGIGLCQSADGPRCYYAVGAAVGNGGRNQRTDVLLVQYFLREIFAGSDFFTTAPFLAGPLVVDGWIGPQTCKAILHFQTVVKSKGRSIVTDGKVDSAHDTSIFHTTPTIYWMNIHYKHARPKDWPKVSMAHDCPKELRLLLREPPAPPFC